MLRFVNSIERTNLLPAKTITTKVMVMVHNKYLDKAFNCRAHIILSEV